MPRFRFNNVFHIRSNLKAYLRLEAGVGKQVPGRLGENDNPSDSNASTDESRMCRTLARAAFASLGPWVTSFKVAGEHSGGAFDPSDDARIKRFHAAFPKASKGSLLELGSHEGGHSVVLAKRARKLLALEGREDNLKRARFIKGAYELSNVECHQANLETKDLSELGEFDAVFCSGLLYHLPRPRALLEQACKVSPNLYIATRVTSDGEGLQVRDRVEGRAYSEGGLKKPMAGLSEDAFWPTLEALEALLKECGFTHTRRLAMRSQGISGSERGPMAELAAWRE